VKVIQVDTVEEIVLNPKYKGWRMARIEVLVEGQTYEVGRIKVFRNDELFDVVREKLCDQQK